MGRSITRPKSTNARRVLAIDAGNTRIKWGLNDGSGWLKSGWTETLRAARLRRVFAALPPVDTIVISNVAGAVLRTALGCVLPAAPAALWIRSMAAQCGVSNSYARPARLGSDRWAALIAAHHLHRGAAVVVNAGTALTADALTADGVFVGGIIVPGAELMRAALARDTAGLRRRPGAFSFFPDNTGDAIMSGAVNALCGAVERIARNLEDAGGRAPACLLSGGAAALIAPHLNLEVKVVDNLVLDGLAVIARGNRPAPALKNT
jgi:type III pantothenate kinase